MGGGTCEGGGGCMQRGLEEWRGRRGGRRCGGVGKGASCRGFKLAISIHIGGYNCKGKREKKKKKKKHAKQWRRNWKWKPLGCGCGYCVVLCWTRKIKTIIWFESVFVSSLLFPLEFGDSQLRFYHSSLSPPLLPFSLFFLFKFNISP